MLNNYVNICKKTNKISESEEKTDKNSLFLLEPMFQEIQAMYYDTE